MKFSVPSRFSAASDWSNFHRLAQKPPDIAMTEIETMTRALSQQCTVSHGNSNNGNNKVMGGRRVSKEEAPLKNFRSRTESVTSNTSENGQKQVSLTPCYSNKFEWERVFSNQMNIWLVMRPMNQSREPF